MLTTEALRAGKEGCWTSGDGALTFRSPEGRGEFIRVLDESRGIDAGRAGGSWQVYQFEDHVHGQRQLSGPSGTTVNYLISGAANGANSDGAVTGNRGTETRPRNIAYPGRIKLI